jgi:poly-beta-hydroxybutyrate-responsive repressor
MSGKKKSGRPFEGKRERYIQPSLLMGLYLRSSYGYDLIQSIHRFGFVEQQPPPGMIYRHLRQLEEEGLVSSEWETEGAGPAKRMYLITEEGKEALALWIQHMEKQARNIDNFVREYRKAQGTNA